MINRAMVKRAFKKAGQRVPKNLLHQLELFVTAVTDKIIAREITGINRTVVNQLGAKIATNAILARDFNMAFDELEKSGRVVDDCIVGGMAEWTQKVQEVRQGEK